MRKRSKVALATAIVIGFHEVSERHEDAPWLWACDRILAGFNLIRSAVGHPAPLEDQDDFVGYIVAVPLMVEYGGYYWLREWAAEVLQRFDDKFAFMDAN